MITKATNVQPDNTAIRAKFEAFLTKLGAKDRTNVERHLTACDTEPTGDHANLWKRLAGTLHDLAGHAVQTSGSRAVRFYVADGKYRMQAFALEDPGDHTLVIYATDVLKRATKSGVLTAPAKGQTNGDGAGELYGVAGDSAARLRIESLDSASSEAPEYYRHMLGWNRKAIKITLPTTASPAQIRAAEAVCSLAADPSKAQ